MNYQLDLNSSIQLIEIFKNDNDNELCEFLSHYTEYNLLLTKLPENYPKPMRQSPLISHVAAYYGAINCLKSLFGITENFQSIDFKGFFFFFF